MKKITYLYFLIILVKKIEIWRGSRFTLELHIVADDMLLRRYDN